MLQDLQDGTHLALDPVKFDLQGAHALSRLRSGPLKARGFRVLRFWLRLVWTRYLAQPEGLERPNSNTPRNPSKHCRAVIWRLQTSDTRAKRFGCRLRGTKAPKPKPQTKWHWLTQDLVDLCIRGVKVEPESCPATSNACNHNVVLQLCTV